ncbi:MAG: TonB-dependent receptor [Halieaceae bacterium]|nr:TonB-dependent receptor [Halieaceae bacterium]
MTYLNKTRPAARRSVLAAAVSSALLCMATGAGAQATLEEIVVTAQKRTESLMDVPISISAVSGEKIADANIQRAEELTAYVPNFQVNQDPIGDKINIRGIQSGNQAGFEQSVATFVDGIYRGRGTQSRFSFLDVARVEVLRGPQPALFGRNTIAGAVNISTNRPTDEFTAQVLGQYNPEFDETELQGFISGPITDSLRGRLVLLDRQMDEGWVDNKAYNEDNPDSDETFGRISLEWDATDATRVALRAEWGDFEINGQPWVIAEGGPIDGLLADAGIPTGKNDETFMGNNGFGPFAGDDTIDLGSVGILDGDSAEYGLTIEHELASGALITAIAGYSEYDFERFLDADFNPLPIVRFDDTEDYEQTSFELRLTSDVGGTFEYILGAYYQDNEMYVDGLTQFNLPNIGGLLGGNCALGGGSGAIVPGDPGTTAALVAATVPGSTANLANACAQTSLTEVLVPAGVLGASRYAFLDQDTETWAIFTQATWNVNDRLRATVGLRYTEEEKDAAQGAYAAEYVAESNTPLADQNPETNPEALAAVLLGEFTTHSFTSNDPGMSRDDEAFTWSFNVQYDLTPDAMVYGSAATGFKAGGYNSFYMGLPQGLGADSREVEFEDEEVLTFELGAKMTLLDGAAELNVAIFRSEYDDLQASIFAGNTTFEVQNAAEATSQGIELDGRWQVTDRLLLSASVGYLDFEFDEFPNQACVAEQFLNFREAAYQDAVAAGDFAGAAGAALLVSNQTCAAAGINDLEGKVSENTPDWSAALIAEYVMPIGRYELRTAADLSYSDDVFRQGDLDPVSKQDSFTKVNASIIFGPDSGDWDVSLVGKNLTDEDTYSYVNDMPLFNGARQGRLDAPRSYAVRGRYRF